MISLTQYYDHIWKACNGKEYVLFNSKTEFIDATQLSRYIHNRDLTPHWRTHKTTRKLCTWLLANNEISDIQLPNKVGTGTNTFIHPSLAPHFAAWLDAELNYPICKLLQAITINCDKGLKETKPTPPVHNFSFFDLNPLDNTMLKYFAMECATHHVVRRTKEVMEKHPRATLIFQHVHVPDTTKVIHAIVNDWNANGNIAINKYDYCGTKLKEVKICNLLRQFCNSTRDPTVCRSAYDSVDTVGCKYDYVE